MGFSENMIADYLQAAARGATSGKTVTFYLGGAGRPDFQYMVVDYLGGPCSRARPPCLKTQVCTVSRRSTAGSTQNPLRKPGPGEEGAPDPAAVNGVQRRPSHKARYIRSKPLPRPGNGRKVKIEALTSASGKVDLGPEPLIQRDPSKFP